MGGANIDYFTENLSSCTFFEITTSEFQEVFFDIFRKLCQKIIFLFKFCSNRFFFNIQGTVPEN